MVDTNKSLLLKWLIAFRATDYLKPTSPDLGSTEWGNTSYHLVLTKAVIWNCSGSANGNRDKHWNDNHNIICWKNARVKILQEL